MGTEMLELDVRLTADKQVKRSKILQFSSSLKKEKKIFGKLLRFLASTGMRGYLLCTSNVMEQ